MSSSFTVSVLSGQLESGWKDGAAATAKFNHPYHLCDTKNDTTLLTVCDTLNNRLREVNRSTGSVYATIGSGIAGCKDGSIKDAQFHYPTSACADPARAGGLYIGEHSSIRYFDGKTVTTIAGHATQGFADGAAKDARFNLINAVLITANGQTLYIGEHNNNRLRCMDLKSRTVKTLAGTGKAASVDGVGTAAALASMHGMCFERSAGVKLESVILIATMHGLRRYEIASGELCLRWGLGELTDVPVSGNQLNSDRLCCDDPPTLDRLFEYSETGQRTTNTQFYVGCRMHSKRYGTGVVHDIERTVCNLDTGWVDG